jgi:hypothetical protein
MVVRKLLVVVLVFMTRPDPIVVSCVSPLVESSLSGVGSRPSDTETSFDAEDGLHNSVSLLTLKGRAKAPEDDARR